MRLTRLRLLRTPGIRTPFTLEPAPGFNLVTGPNGVGKSSVCRAVQSLLWPEMGGEEPFEAEAEFEIGADKLTVSRRDLEQPRWSNGQRPDLGPSHLAGRYRLGVTDLLVPDPGGDVLAREIRKHMAGGFDLGNLRDSLFPMRTGRSENIELKRTALEVTRLKGDQQSLALEQDRLKELEAECELAGNARNRLTALENLAELIRQNAVRDDAAERLKGLPKACAAVRPEDPGNLEKLRSRERHLLGEIESRTAAVAAIDRELNELRAHGSLNPDLPLGLLKKKHEDLLELRRDLRRAERDAEGTNLDEVLADASLKPALWRFILLLAGGAAMMAGGLILPLSGPAVPWVMGAVGGCALGVGLWGFLQYRQGSGRAGIALEKEMETAQLRDHRSRCRGQLDDALVDFNATLAVAGIDPVADADDAGRLLDELAARRQSMDRLDSERRTHAEFLERERGDLDRVLQEVKATVDRLGLKDEPGAGAEAARLLELLPRFQRAEQERDDAGRQIDRLSRLVTQNAALLKAAETPEISAGRLADLIEIEKKRASEHGSLLEEIARIRAEVDRTSRGHELQEALAASGSALAALTDVRRDNRESALGQMLLNRVEVQHEKESRPLVLEKADEYFHLFTRKAHRLVLAARSDGEDRFQALSADSVDRFELDQLSDGTRAQLLLAVKLAFTTVAEEGVRPPVFLDDSLTSADPERFTAVVASLGELAAREGRQIFYLTPNPSDAAFIQRALAEAGRDAAHHIDLARLRGRAEAVDPGLLDPANLPCAAMAPDPTGMNAAEYAAALLVPRPDPWGPRGNLHVIFLLEDRLDLVRRLVDANAADLGRFETSREVLVSAGVITAGEAALVSAGAELWSAWLDGWRLGRARPVTREFLKGSSAVSEKFLESVTAALEECGWDGAGLLEAIEARKVKGFRTDKREQLRTELEDADLLAHGAPLTDDALLTHARDRVAHLLADHLLDMQKVRTLALTFKLLVEKQTPLSPPSS